MPKISALIHAHEGDALQLARLLDSLRPCDEVVIINHGGKDVSRAAHEHGAVVKTALPGVTGGAYAVDARHDWVLCLLPSEALSEALEAALHEWKESDHDEAGVNVAIREETQGNWQELPPETRLVNRTRLNWTEELPPNNPSAPLLAGELLRFGEP